MQNLSLNGWADGITASLIVLSGIIFASIVFYKAFKLKADLLYYGAAMGLFATFLWWGPTLDFLWIIFINENLPNQVFGGLYGILSYMWVAPTLICAQYLGSRLVYPEKKNFARIIFILYSIIGVFFTLFLLFDTANVFNFTYPTILGSELIDASFKTNHLGFFFIVFFLGSVLMIDAIGSFIAAKKNVGSFRKKLIALGFVFILFVSVAMFDALYPPGPFLFIVRIGMIGCTVLIYIALKP